MKKFTAVLGIVAMTCAMATPGFAQTKKKKKMKKAETTEMASEGGAGSEGAAESAGGGKVSYGMAGCGLGTMVMKKDTKFNQLLALSTNGTSNSQTFGITSGTSGCAGDGPAAGGAALRLEEQKVFVANNLSTLEREAAQGTGETLQSLAVVSRCSADAFGKFAAMSQAAHADLFASADAVQIVDALNARIASDASLVDACLQD